MGKQADDDITIDSFAAQTTVQQDGTGAIQINANNDSDADGNFITLNTVTGAANGPEIIAANKDSDIIINALDVALDIDTFIDNDDGTIFLLPKAAVSTASTIGLGTGTGADFEIDDTEFDAFGDIGIDAPTIQFATTAHTGDYTIIAFNPDANHLATINLLSSSSNFNFITTPSAIPDGATLNVDTTGNSTWYGHGR